MTESADGYNTTYKVNGSTVTSASLTVTKNAENNITIYNTQSNVDVTFKKYADDEKTPLNGATFVILSGDAHEDEEPEPFAIENGETGKTVSPTPGEYQLVEKTSPAGYIILSEPIYFTVSGTTVSMTTEVKDGKTVVKTSDEVATVAGNAITVYNVPGTPLPSTGGIGTAGIFRFGVMVMLVSVAAFGVLYVYNVKFAPARARTERRRRG